jgi:DNA helicase II / ATP-dependent DNA helicase PcrA
MLNELNRIQRQAVEFCDGPSLVVAGAGSGKTRVLTYKIAYLIQKGVSPNRILALTFTNKAAEEMKERIDDLLSYKASRNIWMGTFHSVFYKILRIEAQSIGFNTGFTIYDAQDSKSLISSLIKELNLNDEYYKAKFIQNRISQAKNNLLTPASYSQNCTLLQEDKDCRIDRFSELYTLYCKRLKTFNAMDFDDLLLYTNILFKQSHQILEKYRKAFDFVLVDEYQDTNFAQYLIVHRLSEMHRKLCVVGDDAQSIYSFRGAQIRNILNFKNDYPDYQLFKLEQNYRSTQNIVDAANTLIAKNKEQIPKRLYSKNIKGNLIKVFRVSASSIEGFHVASQIGEMAVSKHYAYSDFAILYRTNAQSRVMEEALRKYNIPYKVFGGMSFYQRKEIKDALAYLRLISNNNDAESLRRIINYPSRKIGNVSLGKIFSFSTNADIPIWELVNNPNSYNIGINSGTAARVKSFANLISDFSEQIQDKNAYEITEEILKKSGLMHELYSDKTPEGVSRHENVQEFLNAVKDFCESREKEFPEVKPILQHYLENVSLITDLDDKKDDTDKNFVSLMTIHSAKGLEFKNVFIVGVEENLFPGTLTALNPKELEEERRLFYVAMTRAMENLCMTHCDSRYRYGKSETASPSRFINDVAQEYIEFIGKNEDDDKDDFSNEFNRYSGRKNKEFVSKTEKLTIKTNKKLISINAASNKDHVSGCVNTDSYRPGLKVSHKSFGKGVIVSVSDEGENSKAIIDFDETGTRTLLLKFAKLDIIG